jgi:hypothetical protein
MKNDELKKKIAELLKEAPQTEMEKEAFMRKGLESVLKGVIRGSNFLSTMPERVANAAKTQVFGGRALHSIAGPFTPSKTLKSIVKNQLNNVSPAKGSVLATGAKGDVFKSVTKNIYRRGEKTEGVTGLAKSIFSPSAWNKGLDTVFSPIGSVAGKKVPTRGAQRALGFLTNNPLDVALTAMEYQAAKTKEEKREVLTKGVPSMMLSNVMMNLGGKQHSLAANLLASAIAHKTVTTAWKAGKSIHERKNNRVSK